MHEDRLCSTKLFFGLFIPIYTCAVVSSIRWVCRQWKYRTKFIHADLKKITKIAVFLGPKSITDVKVTNNFDLRFIVPLEK